MEEIGRRSRDKKINQKGKILIKKLEEVGWCIINGDTEGDRIDEFTFENSRGRSVIDYVIGDDEVKEEIERLEVGGKIDSDHYPLEREREIWIRGDKGEVGDRRQRIKKGMGRRKVNWIGETGERLRDRLGRIRIDGGEIREEWERMKREVGEILDKVGRKEKRKDNRGWWDEECRAEKKRVKAILGKWRRGEIGGERYKEIKKDYRELCDRKEGRKIRNVLRR